ncbi:MAG: hypothetical protein K2Z81_07760, partial [Cyanobacteria bacterium]|nr:hypothetical protein [Cyanobacteriota bacterium]
RAIPLFMAPGITGIVEDGQTLEVDYPNRLVRNPASGAAVVLRPYPPLIEAIFSAGGLPEYAFQRYQREVQGS